MTHLRRLVPVAALLVALGAAGCAIPTQGAPSSIAPSKVPFDLMDPHLPTTTTTQPKPSSLVGVRVYFLNAASQLVNETRFVASPAPLTSIVTALLAGPTKTESVSGIFTAIPSNVSVLSATEQDNIVTVNMNSAFGDVTGTSTELAVGQIVATVTAETGLSTGVVFEIGGQRAAVPISNGSLVTGPVYLLQFLGTAP